MFSQQCSPTISTANISDITSFSYFDENEQYRNSTQSSLENFLALDSRYKVLKTQVGTSEAAIFQIFIVVSCLMADSDTDYRLKVGTNTTLFGSISRKLLDIFLLGN